MNLRQEIHERKTSAEFFLDKSPFLASNPPPYENKVGDELEQIEMEDIFTLPEEPKTIVELEKEQNLLET